VIGKSAVREIADALRAADLAAPPPGSGRVTCPDCDGNGLADGIGDTTGLYGSDNCGACGGQGTVPDPARWGA
jgi:hypothetical protein